MNKTALDSIKNDDLWVFKTDYNNTDIPWLELIIQCTHFNSTECLTYLLEDMDFATVDDYVNTLNTAITKDEWMLNHILKESKAFSLLQYLEVTSLEQQKAMLQRLLYINYSIDWEELFDSGVISKKVLIEILKGATFNLSNLLNYISYLQYAEIEHDDYSQTILQTFLNVDVIPSELASDLFSSSMSDVMNKDTFDIGIDKCCSSGLDSIFIDGDLSEDLITNILKNCINTLSGAAITKHIDLTAQLIESEPRFAQSIISHRDFEFDTDEKVGDEHQAWEWSIARSLFNSEKFDAIRVLVDNGAKVGSFTKLYFGEEYLLARGVFEFYCEQSDHERFLGEIKQLLENGVTSPQAILGCVNGDIVKFNFYALYKLLSTHSTITSKQASDFIIAYYGKFITSSPNTAFTDAGLEYKKDDYAYDSHHNYTWDDSRLVYVGEGDLTSSI
ncbi:hypothetical protein [Aliivibrio salmonicida]|uniref:hypothetical protein n=1 Tax=Aliivibrio salmonicida TaxID=40269 RepID=UPI003D0EEA58